MHRIRIYNCGELYLDLGLSANKREVHIYRRATDDLLDAVFYSDFSFRRVMEFLRSRIPERDRDDTCLFDVLERTRGRMYDDSIEIGINRTLY